MQTCPSCLSDDIPDGATHCRHCGRRLKRGRAPLVGFILLIAAAVLWVLVAWARSAADRDAARSRALSEIKSLKAVHCTPDMAEEFDNANTRQFENELDRSSLDLHEKEMLTAELANAMELAGCGFNARNQPRTGSRR